MAELPTFNIENLRFLIIDGDENMRKMVVGMLQTFGARENFEANNAEEAIKILKDTSPDIIICEWKLEDTNGTDLAKTIRKGEGCGNPMVAIIFLTSYTQKSLVEAARDAGITEYLVKPISSENLYSRICSVIQDPRTFIEADNYIGPDRRRQHDPYKVGNAQRIIDKSDDDGSHGDVSDDDIDAMLGI